MDPLTAATTFATLTQLIAQYINEKKSQEPDVSFGDWLTHQKLDQIKGTILNIEAVRAQAEILLKQDHQKILADTH